MPPPRSRRPEPGPNDDPGYEVVESPPVRVAKPISAVKKLASPVRVKPKPIEEPAEDPGYEVVEAPTKPMRKKPVVAVEEEEEEEDDDRENDDTLEEDRPVRKSRKKKRRRRSQDDDEEVNTSQAWWVAPVVLIIIGLVLSFVGAFGTASGKKQAVEAIGTGLMLAAALVQFVVTIPLSILALIIGGKLCGIEYGTPMQAIANIAAVGSMMMGIDWMLEWVGLWYSAIHVITFIVGFSMFMTLFQLDNNEVWISLFFMKLVTVVSFFAMVFLFLATMKKANHYDDISLDDEPAIKQKDSPQKGKMNEKNGRGFNPDEDD